MSFQPPAGPSTAVSYGGRGSMGPVIGVLAVILVLAVVAAIVGRLCSGRSVFGYGHFDVEGWIERKCASCIDGRIESGPPPPRPPPPPEPRVESDPLPAANGGGGEVKNPAEVAESSS